MRAKLQIQLEQGMQELGVAPGENQSGPLLDYLELVEKWNKSYNLTRVTAPHQMIGRHLLDSLALLPYIHGAALLDIGSGAGLPGIPLAITRPGINVVLLDSGGKKIRFLNHIVRTLHLNNVNTVHERIEAYQPALLPDTICARAVTALPQTIEWCAHLMGPDTRLLAMKGRYPEQELLALPAGFMIDEVLALDVPGEPAERHLVIVCRDKTIDIS